MSFKAIAYYLPQYYPTPENDRWWGRGFTEWTNVAKAKPLFPGHQQPHFPADLGYYDLRVPEVRELQASIAQAYGVHGFVYYHYWFGDGRKLLDRPLQDILKTKRPDYPFCVCWANQTWKGVWFGEFTGKTLMEQYYPGKGDYAEHFYYLLPAFQDTRYIKVDGKPVFNIYIPEDIPDLETFTGVFHELAIKEGLPGMFFIGSRCQAGWDPRVHGFDAVVGSEMLRVPYWKYEQYRKPHPVVAKAKRFVNNRISKGFFTHIEKPRVIEFGYIVDQLVTGETYPYDYYPCVLPNWDNTPRMGVKGMVFQNATPALLGRQLDRAIQQVAHLPENRQFVFIKSWNEWAEGNYLEPDRAYGYAYLEEIGKRAGVC